MTGGAGIRIYGTREHGSFGAVTRGLCEAAQSRGLLEGMLPYDLVPMIDELEAGGCEAPVAIQVGNPAYLSLTHTAGDHRARWLMLAPNSEGLPEPAIREILMKRPDGQGGMVDGLLAPSRWACQVLTHCFPELPVRVVPHGVLAEFGTDPRVREQHRQLYRERHFFNVLHIATSHGERKGTRLLLEAWGMLAKRGWLGAARLAVMAHPLYVLELRHAAEEQGGAEVGIGVFLGMSMKWRELAALYRNAHCVCQPSRAEGFGMVPLEALCCGVPVVATACTGHAEYLECNPFLPGSVVVPHGVSDEVDDYPGATAPTVAPEDIADALEHARSVWLELSEEAEVNAAALAAAWNWKTVAGPGLARLVQDTLNP
jgi:glycosyltransferase involved in cell wall biosynthesis